MTLDSGSRISLKLHWWPSRSQKLQNAATIAWTAKMVVRTLRRRSEWKRSVWLRKRQRNQGCNWDSENNISMNSAHRWGIVCLLHRLAECIWPCKPDQINSDPTGKYIDWRQKRLIRKPYTDRSAKYEWIKDRQDVRRMEEELHKDVVSHWLYSTCAARSLPWKLSKDVKINRLMAIGDAMEWKWMWRNQSNENFKETIYNRLRQIKNKCRMWNISTI
jgi:hypothetical protein